jgi:hypothetical protein
MNSYDRPAITGRSTTRDAAFAQSGHAPGMSENTMIESATTASRKLVPQRG